MAQTFVPNTASTAAIVVAPFSPSGLGVFISSTSQRVSTAAATKRDKFMVRYQKDVSVADGRADVGLWPLRYYRFGV